MQLVLQASALAERGSGGEVFMLDMGEPVLILDLAERMIRLSGRQPGRDIKIEVTGTRPGEKLAEELVAVEETELLTSHQSILLVTQSCVEQEQLERRVLQLEQNATELDADRCRSDLGSLAGISPALITATVSSTEPTKRQTPSEDPLGLEREPSL